MARNLEKEKELVIKIQQYSKGDYWKIVNKHHNVKFNIVAKGAKLLK